VNYIEGISQRKGGDGSEMTGVHNVLDLSPRARLVPALLACAVLFGCSSGAILEGAGDAKSQTPASATVDGVPSAPRSGDQDGAEPPVEAQAPALDPVTGEEITPSRAPAQLQGVGADPGPNPSDSPSKLFERGEPVSGCLPDLQSQAASTPLRRLTREQYDNTVRDLFARVGISVPALAARFSPDDYAGSFPANAAVVASEGHIRAYADAAEHIADAVSSDLAKLVPCDVAAGDADCAKRFALDFGMRAYRRPVDRRQLETLLRIFELGAARGFEYGIRLVLETVLQSPYFLYHVEYTPAAAEPAIALDAYELAARLSYFLWDSLPDDALFEAARSGALNDPDVLRQQAERMLADARAGAALAGFTTHWLELDGLADLAPDNAVYPDAALNLPPDSLAETLRFVDYVVRGEGDGSLTTLLTAQFGFPTETLWSSYGVRPPAGYDGSTPLDLPAGQRAGVLTQVSTLFKHSHTQLSPIRRGKYVLNSILCQEISFPENLEIDLDLSEEAGGSVRQKLEGLTQRPECMGCHLLINPIGFAFDAYNRIGQYGGSAASGAALNVPDYMMGPARDAVDLAGKIAQSDAARGCMVKQMQRFALRRKETTADTCTLSTLAQTFAGATDDARRFDVRRLMLGVVTQNSFRFQGARP
jgi:hypothetical protein